MEMLDILKRLESVKGSEPAAAPVVEKPAVLTEGKEVEINLPEPNLNELKALSGVKKQLNESVIAECGMSPMGAPMPSMAPSMPASINMSAGSANEIVSMMRGIMDLAKTDSASAGMGMPAMDPMLKALGDVDMDGDHDMKDHDLEKPDSGALSAGPAANIDDSGSDELADIVKKIKTGEPVKISTDMPVKVTSDEPIKGSTTDKLNARSNDENEEYDNTPKPSTRDYDPNDFAHVINKVRDFDYVPSGSGSNPMPDPNEKKEESVDPLKAFEAKLFDEYKKFVSEETETMSRAAKGHEKYGKKGMKALADAGKRGASEKEMDNIRDKHDKYN